MHIRRIHITNLRAIDTLALDLTAPGDTARRRVILLGGNGSGKTTILSAVSHLFADELGLRGSARLLDAGDVRMGPRSESAATAAASTVLERLAHLPFGTVVMTIGTTSQERGAVAHQDWSRELPGTFVLMSFIGERSAMLRSINEVTQQLKEQGQWDELAKAAGVREDYLNVQKAKQVVREIATPACVLLPADRGTLKSDRFGVSVDSLTEFDPHRDCLADERSRFQILPSLLALAFVAPKRNDPEGVVARMWKVMAKYFPEMPKPVDVHGLRMLFETPDGTIVTLPQLSDGQRALLLIMSELALRNPAHGVVLIDEIEQHLHPRWQQAILEALAALLPDAQFILTSQAPYIAASAPDDVITIGDWTRDGPG